MSLYDPSHNATRRIPPPSVYPETKGMGMDVKILKCVSPTYKLLADFAEGGDVIALEWETIDT